MSKRILQIKKVQSFDVLRVVNLGKNKTQITLRNEIKFKNDQLLLTCFISYKTIVAFSIDNRVFKTDIFWSNTTSRQINLWIKSISNISVISEVEQSFLDEIIAKSGLTL